MTTIEELQTALVRISGNSAIAKARRRAILEKIYQLMNE